jgi:hypothetical protein
MRITKEVWFVIAAVAFLMSWLIDRLAGPVTMNIGSPVAFLSSPILLHTYPLTATAIIIRTFALFVSAMLAFSIVKGKYFTKAIILFFVGMLAEFFAIQQLATGFRVTTIQWTLSIAYGAFSLILGIIMMILMGIWASFNKKEESTPQNEEDKEKSVLEPPSDSV